MTLNRIESPVDADERTPLASDRKRSHQFPKSMALSRNRWGCWACFKMRKGARGSHPGFFFPTTTPHSRRPIKDQASRQKREATYPSRLHRLLPSSSSRVRNEIGSMAKPRGQFLPPAPLFLPALLRSPPLFVTFLFLFWIDRRCS
jgi:hypothetical protein